jgi:hypothetical protein
VLLHKRRLDHCGKWPGVVLSFYEWLIFRFNRYFSFKFIDRYT